MKKLIVTVAVAIGCLASNPLLGQDVSSEGRKRMERAEDMETFATILLENLQKAYSPAPSKRSARRGRGGYAGGYGGGGYGGGGGLGGGEGYGGGGGGEYEGGYGGDEGEGEGGGYGGGGGGLFEEDGGYGAGGGGRPAAGGRGPGMGFGGAMGMSGGGFGGGSQSQSKLASEISTPIAAYLPRTGVVVSVDVPLPILPWEELYDLELETSRQRLPKHRLDGRRRKRKFRRIAFGLTVIG